MSKTTGLVLGKFMPPHNGHVYLIEFARNYCDDLLIVVDVLKDEPIDRHLRQDWLKSLFPDCRVLLLPHENPQQPEDHPDFWSIWRDSLKTLLPWSELDYVFASESYGQPLAEILGAEFVSVDQDRSRFAISGTEVRQRPLAHWSFLPRPVRPYFLQRISIMGAESTGKSVLAESLAKHYQTLCVPEYAETYIKAKGAVVEADMLRFARAQTASEDALAYEANKVLICDTDCLTTAVWSEFLYGQCECWITETSAKRVYPLTLLMEPDVSWTFDTHRIAPEGRNDFTRRCEAALQRLGRSYVKIGGIWEQRQASAISSIDRLLALLS